MIGLWLDFLALYFVSVHFSGRKEYNQKRRSCNTSFQSYLSSNKIPSTTIKFVILIFHCKNAWAKQ